MLRVTKSRFYLVPVLMHALDIMELLSRSQVPLKTNQISRQAGVSQTTTYRILRTLLHRGYLGQDLEGRFSMLNRPELKYHSQRGISVADSKSMPLGETDLSGEQVIEILHSVLQTLRQRNEGRLDHEITGRHSCQPHKSDVAVHTAPT